MRRSPGWPGCRRLARVALVALVATSLAGCDASGSTQGGAPVTADRCADPDLGHTWTDLYDCYFGPSGKTSCVAQGFCHGGPNQLGALYPGAWVCGTSRESCWQGTRQAPAGVGAAGLVCTNVAAPSDAGTDAGTDASDASDGDEAAAPVVPTVCVVPTDDPTSTRLWGDLRGATGGVGLHRMPYAQPGVAGVSFTPQDLDRISAWIREGAQDN